jgi:hypothetical protein
MIAMNSKIKMKLVHGPGYFMIDNFPKNNYLNVMELVENIKLILIFG